MSIFRTGDCTPLGRELLETLFAKICLSSFCRYIKCELKGLIDDVSFCFRHFFVLPLRAGLRVTSSILIFLLGAGVIFYFGLLQLLCLISLLQVYFLIDLLHTRTLFSVVSP